MKAEFEWLPFRNDYRDEVFRLTVYLGGVEIHIFMPFGHLDIGAELQYGYLSKGYWSLAINCVIWSGLSIFVCKWS